MSRSSGGHGTQWMVARRLLVVLLVAAAGMAFVVTGVPEVCQDAAVGGRVTEVCEPMAPTDPRALLYLLVLGLLLLPEVNEVEVAGVLAVRHRLDEVRDEALELRAELAHIRTQAAAVSLATASSRNHIVIDNRQRAAWLADGSAGPPPGHALLDEAALAESALRIGLAGLPSVLPVDSGPATFVGFTTGATGCLEPTHVTGDVGDALVAWMTDAVNESPASSGVIDVGRPEVVAFAHSTLTGGPRCALAVVLAEPVVPAGVWFDDLLAAVGVAARAYARLVADLPETAG
ncbi:MAG: hypothetical protein ACRCYR_10540 [Phycicoccus sp.]